MRPASVLTLLPLVSSCLLHALASPPCPIGTVSGLPPSDYSHTSILVYGSSLRASVPVYLASNASSFALPCLPPGDYILELVAPSLFADHLRVTIGADSAVTAVEPRRDPMRIPGGGARVPGGALRFDAAAGEAVYGEAQPERWALVGYVFNFWTLAQLLVVVFLVGFPRYVGSLDRAMLYEITGETPPDIGDPNGLLKSLLSTRRTSEVCSGASSGKQEAAHVPTVDGID